MHGDICEFPVHKPAPTWHSYKKADLPDLHVNWMCVLHLRTSKWIATSFQTFAVVYVRLPFFWDLMPHQ